uniref:Uncharacterized protein n=1 Tax=Octactis speculum TaxID=3111310 RepID=A0A7S2FCZ4_9STRA|mmetsp:Transcript_20105/g.27311  ORF Transcript_20105/g.27311 Transcript_20105/m.27311 type:complete len:126 (+) Transcript_20105:146-523(+)
MRESMQIKIVMDVSWIRQLSTISMSRETCCKCTSVLSGVQEVSEVAPQNKLDSLFHGRRKIQHITDDAIVSFGNKAVIETYFYSNLDMNFMQMCPISIKPFLSYHCDLIPRCSTHDVNHSPIPDE